jgi:hypothetical protein
MYVIILKSFFMYKQFLKLLPSNPRKMIPDSGLYYGWIYKNWCIIVTVKVLKLPQEKQHMIPVKHICH